MKTLPLQGGFLLRELQREDDADIFAAIDEQRRYLGRWLPFVQFTRSIADSEAFVGSVLDAVPYQYVFTIRDRERFAGLIGFKSTDCALRSSEIGYWLREEYQGQGLMTGAVRRLCRFAAEELGLRRIAIHCATGNAPSNRIPQRLGFKLVHVIENAELLEDGHFADANVYEADPAAVDGIWDTGRPGDQIR